MAKNIPKVSGMDWIIEHFNQPALEPDEFTVKMVAEKSGANEDSVRSKLDRMRRKGEVTIRKLTIDGTMTNAYKRVGGSYPA